MDDAVFFVKNGSKEPKRFSSREEAEEEAQILKIMPFVAQIRNGKGSMEELAKRYIQSLDHAKAAIEDVSDCVFEYIKVP